MQFSSGAADVPARLLSQSYPRARAAIFASVSLVVATSTTIPNTHIDKLVEQAVYANGRSANGKEGRASSAVNRPAARDRRQIFEFAAFAWRGTRKKKKEGSRRGCPNWITFNHYKHLEREGNLIGSFDSPLSPRLPIFYSNFSFASKFEAERFTFPPARLDHLKFYFSKFTLEVLELKLNFSPYFLRGEH